MSYHVVIPKDITEPGKAYLRAHGCRITVGNGSRDLDYIRELIRDADGILARTGDYSQQVLSAATHLKVVGRHGVGMDGFALDYCRERGIRVVNAPGANTQSVAEHTIGQMIALAHRFSAYDRSVREGDWGILRRLDSWDLHGKTLGIVGVGAIGKAVANMARTAFSMELIGFSPRPPKGGVPQGMELVDDLETLFSRADFVSLHLPLKPETRGIVDEHLLSKMKKDAYLINNARGGVVDEQALVRALQEGWIAGAAVDVFTTEPLERSHPFTGLNNLLLTPHSAALTRESLDRMGLMAAKGIVDVLEGREPEFPVV